MFVQAEGNPFIIPVKNLSDAQTKIDKFRDQGYTKDVHILGSNKRRLMTISVEVPNARVI